MQHLWEPFLEGMTHWVKNLNNKIWINYFLVDFKNLFENLYNITLKENKKFLENSIIENFNANYLRYNFNENNLLTEEIKTEIGKILIEN